MSIYMGEQGSLLIKRASDTDDMLRSDLDPDDVNVIRRRFSFDFPPEALITGDRIEIYTADGSTLELVDGHVEPDGQWFCNIDDAGGVRLYDSFKDAINGGITQALQLVVPSVTKQILVRTRNAQFRCQAQMREWEITTDRAQVDTTVLGEEFVSQYTRGLVSGQGTTTCLWDFRHQVCDPKSDGYNTEKPHYLCELLLRLKQGAVFQGQFFVYRGDTSVWYQADCVVTNAALSFEPGAVVESRVEFVTTGAIELHTGELDGFLLQEDTGVVLQESDEGILLDNDD